MTATNFIAPVEDLAPLVPGPASSVTPSGSAQARAEMLLKSVTSVQEREGACFHSVSLITIILICLDGFIWLGVNLGLYLSLQSWPTRC